MAKRINKPLPEASRTAECDADRKKQAEIRPDLRYVSLPKTIKRWMIKGDPAHNPDIVGPPVPVNLYTLEEGAFSKESILQAYSMLNRGYSPREVSKEITCSIDELYRWVKRAMRPSKIPTWSATVKNIPPWMPSTALDHSEFQVIAKKHAALNGEIALPNTAADPEPMQQTRAVPLPVAPRTRQPMFPLPVATGRAPAPVGKVHPPALGAEDDAVVPPPASVALEPAAAPPSLPVLAPRSLEALPAPLRIVARKPTKYSAVDQVRLERLVGLAGLAVKPAAAYLRFAYASATMHLRNAREDGRIPPEPTHTPGGNLSVAETESWLEATIGEVSREDIDGAVRYEPAAGTVKKQEKLVVISQAMRDRVVMLAGRGKVPLGNIADFVGLKQGQVAEIVVAAVAEIGPVEHAARVFGLDVRAIEIDLLQNNAAQSPDPSTSDETAPSPVEATEPAASPIEVEGGPSVQPVDDKPSQPSPDELPSSMKATTTMMTLSIKTGAGAGFDLSLPVGDAFSDAMIEGLRKVIESLPAGDDVVVTLTGKEAQEAIWPIIPRIISPAGSVRFRFNAD